MQLSSKLSAEALRQLLASGASTAVAIGTGLTRSLNKEEREKEQLQRERDGLRGAASATLPPVEASATSAHTNIGSKSIPSGVSTRRSISPSRAVPFQPSPSRPKPITAVTLANRTAASSSTVSGCPFVALNSLLESKTSGWLPDRQPEPSNRMYLPSADQLLCMIVYRKMRCGHGSAPLSGV